MKKTLLLLVIALLFGIIGGDAPASAYAGTSRNQGIQMDDDRGFQDREFPDEDKETKDEDDEEEANDNDDDDDDDNEDTISSWEFDENVDYSKLMVDAAIRGDVLAGLEAERLRNLKIDNLYPEFEKISFMDLYLLSKIMTAEAGSYWLSMDWKMMVGEVLLNRVASPEFPDSIEECIYQPGQYYSRNSRFFANLTPYKECVRGALRLLRGERIISDPSVVFQASFRQGSGIAVTLHDKYLGYTYLCYSSRPWLYE